MTTLARKINLLPLCKPAWLMECSSFVPSNQDAFLRTPRIQLKTAVRFFKRKIFMALLGQSNRCVGRIPPEAQRILWINMSAPSLGDALMDVSGRVLLSGRSVTLITRKMNAFLFNGDPFFESVIALESLGTSLLVKRSYDLVILDSFSPRTLLLKARLAKKVPFVGLWGYLNAYEVHRTIFSFRRIERLLGMKATSEPRVTCPHFGVGVSLSLEDVSRVKVAIGVGGEWGYRTYTRWDEVLKGLFSVLPNASYHLVGSSNGIRLAEDLLGDPSLESIPLFNHVGKYSLEESAAILRQCTCYVGADGGLWHIAVGVGLPTVVMFARKELYDSKGKQVGLETEFQPLCEALHTQNHVDEVEPSRLVAASQKLIDCVDSVSG